VTEEHFERAAGISTGNGEAVQNAAQQNAEPCCTASHTVGESAKFNTEKDLATQCEEVVGDAGIEPATR
jgi:hypothetical protein